MVPDHLPTGMLIQVESLLPPTLPAGNSSLVSLLAFVLFLLLLLFLLLVLFLLSLLLAVKWSSEL